MTAWPQLRGANPVSQRPSLPEREGLYLSVSRPSSRMGQTEAVQVVFMAYRNELQAAALTLVAKKRQSALAVECRLSRVTSWLSSLADAGHTRTLPDLDMPPR